MRDWQGQAHVKHYCKYHVVLFTTKGGRLYFIYKYPALPKPVGYGYDQEAAFDVARQMNKELGPGRDLIAKTYNHNQNSSLPGYIEYFCDTILPGRRINGDPLPQRKKTSKERDHWTQLSRKQISDGFAAARDACGLFDETPPDERPTFHELISLGEYLLQQSGWTLRQIQTLRGHSTEKMTLHYLDGHDWTTVETPKIGRN